MYPSKKQEKERARELREQCKSLGEIAAELNVSKGTVSLWVRDIPLTDQQKQSIADVAAAKRASHPNLGIHSHQKSVKRRNHWQEIGRKRIATDAKFGIICGIYWGEGTKKSCVFKVTNSDPEMIRIVFNWLVEEGFLDKIRFSVNYHEDNGHSESDIIDWWMKKIPGLQRSNFNKLIVKNIHNVKNIGKLPFGTAYVCVSSLDLQQMVLGGISGISQL